MKAPLPPNEAQRLETLRCYGVLDTLPEQAFDDLTMLAAQICQVPIAVVSLVDENRQWFKSIIGLDAKETPRDVAFCAYSILNPDELLEVQDAMLDPRFADNPLVTNDPHIRFYAGAPLVAPDGHALGTLCVIDRVPRQLSTEQKGALRALSRTVIAQLELRTANRRAKEQVEERTADLQQEIEIRRESEEQIRQLLKENETILNNALVGIVHFKQRRVVSCSRRMEEMFQYEPGELIGESSERFYDSRETFDQVGKVAYQAMAEGKSYTSDLRLRHKDGSLFWGTVSGRAPDTAHPNEGSIWIYSDITDRKEAAQATQEAKERAELIFQTSPDAVLISRLSDGYITDVNYAFAHLSGYTREESIGNTTVDLNLWVNPNDRQKFIYELQTKGFCENFEAQLRKKDGSQSIGILSARITEIKGVPHIVSTTRDITEYKRVEEALRISATAFETQESLMITDANQVILRVNKAFTEDTGYTAEEVVGQTPRLLKSGRQNAAFYSAMWKSIRDTGAWQGEIWDRRKNGEIYPKWLSISAVKGDDGIVTHYVGSHIDITERKAAEEKIHYLGFYDDLTQLPNRRLLMDRLHQALASSARIGRSGALLFIDLDNFKTLNDNLGHHVGDLYLQQTAQRLISCVREDDTVARLGGDEFVVVLENLGEQAMEAAAQTETISEKILMSLRQPYQLDVKEYQGTASIGATVFNDHNVAIDELMKQADIAMYQAKQAGRNTVRFFDENMQASITGRFSLEGELRKALENQEFQLYYQIQVDNLHRRPLGAEVLIRWNTPLRGLVLPMQFIPLAEETGLILPIGQWVLETACAQLKVWQQDAPTRDLVLAVNVSARQFRQADFVGRVQAAVQHHAIDPKQLKLELTEGMLLENIEETIATMNALNELDIQFSLDDFGTGYSSLQYLKQLPLDQIKIDRSFVRDITSDPNDAAIVQTIIAMAETLGLNVVAEGVETEAQREFLQLRGCSHFQGYLFGRPMPIEQFEASLKQT